MEIYIIRNGAQFGPLSIDELAARAIELGLTPDTPVWYQGLADWTPMKAAPATAELAAILPPVFNATPPPTMAPGMNAYSTPDSDEKPPMPDNYLVWAILSLVCCCLPLGIVSLVYSCRVSTLYYRGEYDEAYKASNNAKNWAIASAIAGAVISVLSFGVNLMFGLFAL